jgi:hypothetical protein
LNCTQISLQIIKRFEKEKDFPNSYLVMGQNLAGNRVRPGQPLLSPPPFLFFVRPSPASLQSQPSRVCPDSPAHGWCSGPRKAHSARSALWPTKPSSVSAEPSNGPAASSHLNRARRLRGGVTKPESLFPNQKNLLNPNQCPVQTPIGDGVRVESLLRTIEEQNPYK